MRYLFIVLLLIILFMAFTQINEGIDDTLTLVSDIETLKQQMTELKTAIDIIDSKSGNENDSVNTIVNSSQMILDLIPKLIE